MTLSPSDSPDWTGIPGGARYLGMIDMTGTAGTITGSLAVSPASYDGAIYVIPIGSPFSSTFGASINLSCTSPSATFHLADYYAAGFYLGDPFVGMVSAGIGPNWSVGAQIDNASGSTWKLYVFAIPEFPLATIVRDQLRLLIYQTDVPRRLGYIQNASSIPAAGVRATVTFAAVTGRAWVLDHATWRLMGRGAADIQLARVLDGAGVIYNERMSVQAVAGDRDRAEIPTMSGWASTPGNALTVDFAAAPGAANFEVLNAGAYLGPWAP